MTELHGRIAYVISRYPLVTHTFVRREIAGLRSIGVEVSTFSVRASEADESLSAEDRNEAARTTALVPPSTRAFVRGPLAALCRNPLSVLAIARDATSGHRLNLSALIWRLFYVVEALLLWDECSRRGIRHIHAHHGNVAADLAQWACEFGRRVEPVGDWTWSFTLHGPREFMEVGQHGLGRKAASASSVICISDFTRSQLMLHSSPADWHKFVVVHCGIDPEEFAPSAAGETAESPYVVLALGRMTPQKGVPLLLDAAEALQDLVDTPVRFVVGGDGPDRHGYARAAEQRGLDMQFVGAVPPDQTVELYRTADAFCLPSFMEGLPVVLMEAMASAVPVVATSVAGIGELVEDEVTGLTVPPGRGDLLAAQLARLINDSQFARTLGAAGRERVLRDFTIEQAVRELRPVLLNGGPVTSCRD